MPAPRHHPNHDVLAFRALGPLQVVSAQGEPVLVGQQVHRSVLAVLLLRAGQTCSREWLTAALWGSRPPGPDALYTAVYGVRKALRTAGLGERVQTRQAGPNTGGWVIRAGEREADVLAFRALAAAGRSAWYRGDIRLAADKLGGAVRLWRGDLADLPATPAVGPAADRLRAELRDAQDLEMDARLALGEHGQAVTVLRARTRAEPMREHPWAQLMRALQLAGDTSAALSVFTAARAAMAAEYGSSPGPELVEVRREVLSAGRARAAGLPAAALSGV